MQTSVQDRTVTMFAGAHGRESGFVDPRATSFLTDADLSAIAVYLKALEPIENKVEAP